ncbi:MAG: radical SAM protein [Methanomassiliicoccales archaeon]|jgi:biotin synthase-related radical SAM superfamily protein
MEAGLSVAMKKAILITGGPLKIPKDMVLPFTPSRSTAGPGAGSTSIVIAFEGARCKKAINREAGEFELVPKDGGYRMLRNGQPFLEDVEIKPTIAHAPEQAFFNLSQDCIYDCKFCASRKLDQRITKNLSPERVVQMAVEASKKQGFKSVSFTSAVVDSPEKTVERLIYVVREVRKALPDVPIGVEPYLSKMDDIEELKLAGATEIKLNIETFDPDRFAKVCGKLHYDFVLEALDHAVEVFGEGKVTTNLLVGLGESDENLLDGIRYFAERGIVATLRPLRINNFNREALTEALGPLEPVTPERIVDLAIKAKVIMEENGITSKTYHTMCHECGCCDIVPFRDL